MLLGVIVAHLESFLAITQEIYPNNCSVILLRCTMISPEKTLSVNVATLAYVLFSSISQRGKQAIISNMSDGNSCSPLQKMSGYS